MENGPHLPRLAVRTPTGWVPLGFVRSGRLVYLIARERGAQWPISLLRSGVAELRLPEQTARGRASLVTKTAEQEEILTLFRTTYGEVQFARWYDRPARILRVDLEGDLPGGLADDGQYSAWLEAEFDNVADDYDHHITGNRMNRLLRDRSLAQIRVVFAGRRRLLEVGCGSGMETITMLRDGHQIVAVDISERMLQVVRAKAEKEGLGGQLTTIKLRARDLATLATVTGLGPFDGAYSTYGALNCEPDLRPIADAFAALLRGGAPFVVGVYNRWCLFELLGYSFSLQGSRAFGRRTNPVSWARLGSVSMCTRTACPRSTGCSRGALSGSASKASPLSCPPRI
ncbi:MAG: methyltransferase domain-containing protein [Thermoplasmata archaeon]|nr:methyltransferase domain-containing protein [Thermoplasmata archaeon]